jgi:short subunit dehydrogenase-like uncharacterized protein
MAKQSNAFLLYGSTGFVGQEIARQAAALGLPIIVAGRDGHKMAAQPALPGVEQRIFGLDDPQAIDNALRDVAVVLHCAGPYIYTSRQMAEACLRTGTHYMDISGEIPVYAALAAQDARARANDVMLLPGVGFDVVPSDCLAAHLKRRLPSATVLALAFYTRGPAKLPPGTAKTMVEMLPYGGQVRRAGQLVSTGSETKTRLIDFGRGERKATRTTWGDVFTAYYSTGIGNIENYMVLPESMSSMMRFSQYFNAIFKSAAVRKFMAARIPAGSTPEQRAQTSVVVWGEVRDAHGRTASARLHGPETGVTWTSMTALAAVEKVLAGVFTPGFQTPSLAFGTDFVMQGAGVRREDLE